MKTLDLQRWKKTSTSTFAYCSKWFRNWIPFIHTSESQIQQLQAFFSKQLCNLKCDCQWIKIPFLFLENSFANVSNSTLYVRKWKNFWRLYLLFENKKSRNENSFTMLAFHSAVTQLPILIWSSNSAFNLVYLCFNRKTLDFKIQSMKLI